MQNPLLRNFEQDGYVNLPEVISLPIITDILREVTILINEGKKHASRAVLNLPSVKRLISETASTINEFSGMESFPVRGIYFDKTRDANWKVPWHQDLSITVKEKMIADGFSGWSMKDNIVQVQPPEEILERMVTLRLHLDECTEDNGPLQVLPGSHQHGRLTSAEIAKLKNQIAPISCLVPLGGILLMRPLLLHASSAARKPNHRRVIHLEFASEGLPCGLTWAVAQ